MTASIDRSWWNNIIDKVNGFFRQASLPVSQEAYSTASENNGYVIGIDAIPLVGDKEAFVSTLLGREGVALLTNPQVYHQLKSEIVNCNFNTHTVLERQNQRLGKVTHHPIDDATQREIIDAFQGFRFYEVRTLLDTLLDSDSLTAQERLYAHYQKALSYMAEQNPRQASRVFALHIPDEMRDRDMACDFARVQCDVGDFARAIRLYSEILEGENTPSQTFTMHHALGEAWYQKGDQEKAMAQYAQVLEYQQDQASPDHHTMASLYTDMGKALEAQSDYDQALDYYELARNMQLELWGEDHPSMAANYRECAMLYYLMKEYTKARATMEQALDLYTMVLEDKHPTCKEVTAELEAIKRKV